jgi:hypothetical protein
LILTLASVLGALTGWAVIAKVMRAEHHPRASTVGLIAALTVAVLWESLLELLDDGDGPQKRWRWTIRIFRIAIVLMVLETIVGASEMLGEAAEDYWLIRQIEFRHIGGFYTVPLLPVYVAKIIAVSLGWAALPGLSIFSVTHWSSARHSISVGFLAMAGVFIYCSVRNYPEFRPLLLASITSWLVTIAVTWILWKLKSRHKWIPLMAVVCGLISASLCGLYPARELTDRIASTERSDLESIVTHYYRFVGPLNRMSVGSGSLDELMVRIKELPISEQLLAANKEFALRAELFNQFMDVQGPLVCGRACSDLLSELEEQRKDHRSPMRILMVSIWAGCLSFWIFPALVNIFHRRVA